MDAQLTKKEIGQRIAQLRKHKGLSQQELAQRVALSRSSLAQLELGNKTANILELQRISHELGFMIDQLLSKDFMIENITGVSSKNTDNEFSERISVPTLNKQKFQNVFLYILNQTAGKPNVGETVLYKLLYFSDFNYYELYEEHLTGSIYRKLPFGPVPHKLDAIITNMIDEGKIERIKTEYHGYPQTRYLPLENADLTKLRASEKQVLDQVIQQMSNWSASAISNYSHKDMPWLTTKDGDVIDYELTFYREPPFLARNYDEDFEE